MLNGIPVSPGIVIGKVLLLDSRISAVPKYKINKDGIVKEIIRFTRALSKAKRELTEIQRKFVDKVGETHAAIFDAHLLILEDSSLIEKTIEQVRNEQFNVEFVFSQVLEKVIKKFSGINDEYMGERVADINDVGRRVLKNLLAKKHVDLSNLKERVVLVSHDLSPSDTAQMNKNKVIGFATEIGGRTSHTAIMARTLEIPAVVGVENITQKVITGDTIIIDGVKGIVIVNPSPFILEKYLKKRAEIKSLERKLSRLRYVRADTLDGQKILLAANIESRNEVHSIITHGANGIGLYRTEFLYLKRNTMPSEEEQFNAYRYVAQKINPQNVVIRTLDLGGDKFISELGMPKEMNPLLGLRAIRFCLKRPDIFKPQLRAILRASHYGNVSMMFPMISGLSELREAKVLVEGVKKELDRENLPYDRNIKVGVMIEVPSAALIADILAKEADFFSIGTNDLIQYSFALDRVNEKISYLYRPNHPAVYRLIKMIIDAANKADIPVTICGEMAGVPASVLALLGLGLFRFSMASVIIPEIKKLIRHVNTNDAKKVAKHVLELSTGKEADRYLRSKIEKIISRAEIEIYG
ncbi:MAG: phosphoenolpyruvate--protein phosphotransferase [bacterium]|nr:phosphoenolpyruvate--protein phosphotransferase [bacterium]